jgi:NADH:ubiquinone oxidoreductase subunit E
MATLSDIPGSGKPSRAKVVAEFQLWIVEEATVSFCKATGCDLYGSHQMRADRTRIAAGQ